MEFWVWCVLFFDAQISNAVITDLCCVSDDDSWYFELSERICVERAALWRGRTWKEKQKSQDESEAQKEAAEQV